MPATVFAVMGGAWFVALVANVYKHGWHWSSVALGVFLTVLTVSLAVPAQRRSSGWVARYWIAVFACGGLGVYRFLL